MMNIFNLFNQNKKDTKEGNAKFEYTNTAIIAGKIVHVFATDKITILTVSVHLGKPNYPKILCFGDTREKAAQFKAGDFIRIEGNIQSSKVDPGKNLKKVSVFAESLERIDESSLTLPYDVTANINHIEVTGMVMDFINLNNILKMQIRTYKNNRMSIIPIDYYYGADTLKHLKVGDVVSITGHIQTSKKVLNGETIFFENYVAREIHFHDIP